jgi:hypothetical protein
MELRSASTAIPRPVAVLPIANCSQTRELGGPKHIKIQAKSSNAVCADGEYFIIS